MIDEFFAYLDPGTSATLVQLALAGSAGIAAAAKLRMNHLKKRVSERTGLRQKARPSSARRASDLTDRS